MIFTRTRVHEAYVIDLERRTDERGFFARAWCEKEFAAHGLAPRLAQVNVSFNARKRTLRGMHYQASPCAEAKVVSCTGGALYDVVLDLRPESPTYLRWDAVELTAGNRRMLYVPEGCAHGFQTLADDTVVLYFMSEFYSAEHARGVRYDDPAFGIRWPLSVGTISEKDLTWPDYEACVCGDLVRGAQA
jgi:dTDP-4-dehydrorhamnose 3,5-epimerase